MRERRAADQRGKIAGSVVLLAVVLWGVSQLARIAKLDPEIGRKLVHISLGLYCLTFPYVFSAVWEVAATPAGWSRSWFLLARGTMRKSLGGGLHAVQRTSYGELLFAVSVALLFWLKDGHFVSLALHHKPPVGPVLYMLPILILTLCDAASAVVGSRYGKKTFSIEEGSKSVEGVIVFAVTAWLLSLIVILLMTDIGRGEAVLLAFITAAFGALLEAASWRGLDNLFIPLGLYFLLSNLLYLGVVGLAVIAGLFFEALLVLLYVTRHRAGEERHFLAVGSTLFFCIAIFAEPPSVITPAVAVGMIFSIADAWCAPWTTAAIRRLEPVARRSGGGAVLLRHQQCGAQGYDFRVQPVLRGPGGRDFSAVCSKAVAAVCRDPCRVGGDVDPHLLGSAPERGGTDLHADRAGRNCGCCNCRMDSA